jgi:hypothetical protein
MRAPGRRTTLLGGVLLLALALPTVARSAEEVFDLRYTVRLCSAEDAADVEIRVEQDRALLRSLRLDLSADRLRGFEGEGVLVREPDALRWEPPATGGSLRYVAEVDHLRDPAEYDARCTDRWALLRGTDLVPALSARFVAGARARATLRFRLPTGWKAITPFESIEPMLFRIDPPDRVTDAPRGWMIAGHVDALEARIGPTRVVLASPEGDGERRRDRLALLRWTLPSLHAIVGDRERSILIVSAGDPMWRGGLSGPDSLYLHADRPLIESDGTSPLLHEIVHVVMSAESGENGDWVVEGLAELYSIELLRRSGTITRDETEAIFARMREEAREAGRLDGEHARGATVARAVIVLRALDERIRATTDGRARLDDVLRRIADVRDPEPMTPAILRAHAEAVAGVPLDDFFAEHVGSED